MISALVLAAGRSLRFGQTKQLLRFNKKTMLETVVDRCLDSEVDEVVLVLGHKAEEILGKSEFGAARVVLNKDYDKGLSSSLKVGVGAVDPQSEAVIIVLGDQPQFETETINKLVQKFADAGGPIVAPYFERRRGNPILIDRSLFPELKKLRGDAGAKGLIDRMVDKVVKVQVGDMGVLLDIDTEDDYRRLSERRRK